MINNFRLWESKDSFKNEHFTNFFLKVTFLKKQKRILKRQERIKVFSPTLIYCFFRFFANSVSAMEHEFWFQVVRSLNLSVERTQFCRHCFFCTFGACDVFVLFGKPSFWSSPIENFHACPYLYFFHNCVLVMIV